MSFGNRGVRNLNAAALSANRPNSRVSGLAMSKGSSTTNDDQKTDHGDAVLIGVLALAIVGLFVSWLTSAAVFGMGLTTIFIIVACFPVLLLYQRRFSPQNGALSLLASSLPFQISMLVVAVVLTQVVPTYLFGAHIPGSREAAKRGVMVKGTVLSKTSRSEQEGAFFRLVYEVTINVPNEDGPVTASVPRELYNKVKKGDPIEVKM
jgi:hypothetical protein